jgi:hypothetical protein
MGTPEDNVIYVDFRGAESSDVVEADEAVVLPFDEHASLDTLLVRFALDLSKLLGTFDIECPGSVSERTLDAMAAFSEELKKNS